MSRLESGEDLSMHFVEFICEEGAPAVYFAGRTIDAILDDTEGGTRFGFGRFVSHREVSFEEVGALGPRYFQDAVKSVNEGTPSYFIGSVR